MCVARLLAFLLVAPWVALSAIATEAVEATVETLSPSQIYTRSHPPNGRVSYGISLSGQVPHLVKVDQRGIDLILRLSSPSGAITEFDSPVFRDDHEYVLLEGYEQGRYELTLYSNELTDAVGGHAISVEALDAEDERIGAWRLMTSAAAASVDNQWDRARDAYLQSAQQLQQIGASRLAAHALYCAGMIEYWWLGQWQVSIGFAKRAAALYLQSSEPALAANARKLEGLALIELANEVDQSAVGFTVSDERRRYFDDALRLFEGSIGVHERLSRRFDLAEVTNLVGLTYYYMGEFERARSHYKQAESQYESLGELRGQLQVQNNLAVLDTDDGRYRSAAAVLESSLALLPVERAPQLRADLLDNLGNTYRRLGNIDESLDTFSQALALHTRIDDRMGEGRSLHGLGQTYFSTGELDLAREFLERALLTVQETRDGRTHHGVLVYLGDIAYLEGDPSAALALHRRALALATSPRQKINLSGAIARDLIRLQRSAEALRISQDALRAAEKSGSDLLVTGAMLEHGRALLAEGQPEAAETHLKHALILAESLALRTDRTQILHELSLTARARKDLHAAVRFGERAITELEGLRGQLADPELRAFFLTTRREYYETQVETLMELHRRTHDIGFLRQSLETNERSRARMMVDLLSEASVNLYATIDAGMAERQTDLSTRLDALRRRRDHATPADDIGPLIEEMNALENELHLLDSAFRRRNPELTGLDSGAVLTSEQIQSMLEPDTVLLQYALGEVGSYLWVITHDSLHAISLAGREELESAARNALESLSRRGADAETDIDALSILAVHPAQELLRGRNILVVADGALQYIPFGLLSAGSATEGRFLHDHNIVALPSMSAAAAIRPTGPTDKLLAVFADPVFGPEDPRLPARKPDSAAIAPNTTTPASADLARLPFTSREAEWISNEALPAEALVVKGFDASRDAVLSGTLASYRYVHFATHGLIDTRYPALSALAFSRFDQQGNPQNGFLRLHDIFRLDLNAELVVLSACDTALGREVRGEGLMGLTQAFLYAGARTLVVSLWQVGDRVTATLMQEFYRAMINGNVSPAEALRQAQLAVSARGRWRHPYYWGAFVVIGDGHSRK